MEIAFVSNNKIKVGLLKKENSKSANIINHYYNKQNTYLTTILIGNNIALVVFGLCVATLVEESWFSHIESNFYKLLIQTAVSTILVLFLGEFIPKILFQINQNNTLKFFAIPFQVCYYVLILPVFFIQKLSQYLIKNIFGEGNPKQEETAYSTVDLGEFVKSSTESSASSNEDINTTFFDKALHLEHVKIRECMVPRTEIEAIEFGTDFKNIKQRFLESRHSRIPVFKENLDSILGYFHHQDILKQPDNIYDFILDIKVVPETFPADELLDEFIKERKSIARVVDEFGGTAGIVTLEDILEEIFGEIEDEHDEPEFIERQIAKNEWIFSGRLEVDYLNEKYNLNLPTGEYETLAGLIFNIYENIPKTGKIIIHDNFEFKILMQSGNKIDTINLVVENFGEEIE